MLNIDQCRATSLTLLITGKIKHSHATTDGKEKLKLKLIKDKLCRFLPLNTRSGTYYVPCYRLTHEAEFIRSRRMQERQNHLAPLIVRLILIIGDTKSD